MIIKTKSKIFRPHVKELAIPLIALSILFFFGFLVGEAQGWRQCVDFGLHFVKVGNIVDQELIRSALLQYKESLGGWAFDPRSPYYIGNQTAPR